MIESLYIHIPFCDNICSYCDFSKVLTNTFNEENYIQQLIEEIESYHIKKNQLKTIYIGGGTPSALTVKNLTALLSYLHSNFQNLQEFTLEANPESLTEDKILILKKYGVTRVSLGVQTLNTSLLKLLNRKHSFNDVKNCIANLKKYQLNNFNLDFIYGIPGLTNKDIEDEFKFIKEFTPTHVSFYSLQIEEGTMFYIKNIKSVDDSKLRDQYDFINKNLKDLGYFRYEISNFSKPGFESKHNLTYWHDNQYYACGVSASGYIENKRYTNTRSITKYMKGERIHEEEYISKDESEFEFLMLNLRLVEGFDVKEFNKRFNKNFFNEYKKELESCKEDLIITKDKIRIVENKLYIMDSILLKLLKQIN